MHNCYLCHAPGAVAEYDESRRAIEVECRSSDCGDYVITQAAAGRIKATTPAEQLRLSRAAKDAAQCGLILELEVDERQGLTALAVTPRSRR